VTWPTGEWAAYRDGGWRTGVVPEATGLGNSHAEQIRAFARAVREGLPAPVPVEQTLPVIAILEAIGESARLGREVEPRLPSFAAAAGSTPGR
jgi:predicted dehydrogenase